MWFIWFFWFIWWFRDQGIPATAEDGAMACPWIFVADTGYEDRLVLAYWRIPFLRNVVVADPPATNPRAVARHNAVGPRPGRGWSLVGKRSDVIGRRGTFSLCNGYVII